MAAKASGWAACCSIDSEDEWTALAAAAEEQCA